MVWAGQNKMNIIYKKRLKTISGWEGSSMYCKITIEKDTCLEWFDLWHSKYHKVYSLKSKHIKMRDAHLFNFELKLHLKNQKMWVCCNFRFIVNTDNYEMMNWWKKDPNKKTVSFKLSKFQSFCTCSKVSSFCFVLVLSFF